MTRYRVLIVDDEASARKPIFERLFNQDADFCWELAATWLDFEKKRRNYDVILLDVNLTWWGKSLAEALRQIGGLCPVILYSQDWPQDRTNCQITGALSEIRHVRFAGTLVLAELKVEDWENAATSLRHRIRLVVAAQRQEGRLELDSDHPIRILHLSDPQYGDPSEDRLGFLAEPEVARFIQHDLNTEIHFVAVTGDITFSGKPSEFVEAEKKLERLVGDLIPNREYWRERLLMVPGNHDVNLQLAAAERVDFSISANSVDVRSASENTDKSLLRFALQPFRDFAWRLTGNPQWRDHEDLCWINDSFRHLGLRFVLLNSVVALDCLNPKLAYLPKESLEDLSRQRHETELLSVALCHHGPPISMEYLKSCFGNPSTSLEGWEIESISNWDQVGQLIQLLGVKVFLHGHGHARRADYQSIKNGKVRNAGGRLESDEIMRIMAPTSHLGGVLRPADQTRGFSLMTLHRECGRVERIEVDFYELRRGKPGRGKQQRINCLL